MNNGSEYKSERVCPGGASELEACAGRPDVLVRDAAGRVVGALELGCPRVWVDTPKVAAEAGRTWPPTSSCVAWCERHTFEVDGAGVLVEGGTWCASELIALDWFDPWGVRVRGEVELVLDDVTAGPKVCLSDSIGAEVSIDGAEQLAHALLALVELARGNDAGASTHRAGVEALAATARTRRAVTR